MGIFIEITDSLLYQQLVERVETNGLSGEHSEERGDVFDGSIQIYTKDGQIRPWFGFLEADTFEEQYGFILKVSQDGTHTRSQLETYTPLPNWHSN